MVEILLGSQIDPWISLSISLTRQSSKIGIYEQCGDEAMPYRVLGLSSGGSAEFSSIRVGTSSLLFESVD